jgi:hypothetical protein
MEIEAKHAIYHWVWIYECGQGGLGPVNATIGVWEK